MSVLTERITRIAELKQQVAAMAGRKGISALRAELNTLEVANRTADAKRQQMKRNVQGTFRTARSNWSVLVTREAIKSAALSEIQRGAYGEIVVHPGRVSSSSITSFQPRFWNHPKLQHLRSYWQAWAIVNKSVDIPARECEFDRKGRGYAVNVDLYGYNADGSLALVQVRRTEINKYRNTTVRYLVTDGATSVEITNGKKALIKKAATADPRPDSPLRIVRSMLPVEWQARIADEPIKLLSYAAKPWLAWKVFRLYPDGSLKSCYDDTEWRKGAYHTEKAIENHGGGYYVRTGDPAEIMAQFDAGNLVNIPAGRGTAWQAALVHCECRGNTIEYESGKIAVSMCKPVEIVTIW
jgi:hypothetical protein